jgi:Protein of unknown function (DUF1236)
LEVNIMTTLNRIVIAAALLAGGTSLAMAQYSVQTPATNPPHAAKSATHGTDTVILSGAQRRAVWKDLSKQANNQNATGFKATVGTFVPKSMKIEPMPSNVTANNPKLRPYGFALVGNKLLIVDPSNKVIADVLTK